MKRFLFSLFFPALMFSADLEIYQHIADNQLIRVREGATSGYVEADMGTVTLPDAEGRPVEFHVAAATNKLNHDSPVSVYLDSVEDQRVEVGLSIDGKLTWKLMTGPGLAWEGAIQEELTVLLIGSEESQVRRISVDREAAFSAKASANRAAATSGPLSLEFLTRRPNGQVCEVIPNSGLGGRFYSSNARWVMGYYVNCKTDRVSRGEPLIRLLFGCGWAEAGTKTPFGISSNWEYLPTAVEGRVSTDPRMDNLVAFVRQGPWEASMRIPIGSRP